jgi:hypothetical protein
MFFLGTRLAPGGMRLRKKDSQKISKKLNVQLKLSKP